MAETLPDPVHSEPAWVSLLRWWPIQVLAGLFLLLALWATARVLGVVGGVPAAGFAIDTPEVVSNVNAAGSALSLPVAVANGSDQPIRQVSVQADAYACPAPNGPLERCAKFLSVVQDLPMQVDTGEVRHFSMRLPLELPMDRPGDFIRVERSVQTVLDQRDLDTADKFRSE